MKQHISKAQWDELTKEEKRELLDFFNSMDNLWFQMNIGQMIEFLWGDTDIVDCLFETVKLRLRGSEYDKKTTRQKTT